MLEYLVRNIQLHHCSIRWSWGWLCPGGGCTFDTKKSTVAQNRNIPLTSLSFVFGFTSCLINSLSLCQRFSMGFRSGDSEGVCHQLIPWSSMNFSPRFEQCFISLSCMKRWPSGNTSLTNGSSLVQNLNREHSTFLQVCTLLLELSHWFLPMCVLLAGAYSGKLRPGSASACRWNSWWVGPVFL